jgi:hypothetical protein
MALGHPDVGPIPRLTTSVNGFGANSTLASFVQWTSLFFDGPLTLKHFQDVSVVKKENPGKDECDNANWRLKYHCYEISMDEDIVFRMFSVILWVFTKPWLEKSLQLFALYNLEQCVRTAAQSGRHRGNCRVLVIVDSRQREKLDSDLPLFYLAGNSLVRCCRVDSIVR